MIIRAVTFDLDDTLWPFPPIGERIERALHAWLQQHAPATAAKFPIPAMRELRAHIWQHTPEHAHDMSMLRRLTIEHALRESGDDIALTDSAYEVFFAERNRVEFYPDALDALARIARRVPVASLSNGNADLQRIGIMPPIAHALSATDLGVAKPDPRTFLAACEILGFAPEHVLHVGDHIDMDIRGAMAVGMPAAWINRLGESWPAGVTAPSLQFTELTPLADWLERQPPLH